MQPARNIPILCVRFFPLSLQVFAAFLPTAHILELAAEHMSFVLGFAMG